MTLLEGTVLILLLLLALPGYLQRRGQPGLLYPAYIVAGALAGALMSDPVIETWRQVGQLGFVLLLFSVGLEIELPQRRESFLALRRALAWMLPQMALIVGVLFQAGIAPLEGLAASLALASTSVGMAYVLWKHHPFGSEGIRRSFLEWLVAIEVVSILGLASISPIIEGTVWWMAILRFGGLIVAAVFAAFVALRVLPKVSTTIQNSMRIEAPLLVLVLFALCAIGARLGLSAPKMAFVLGLFISRSTDEEVSLNQKLAPLRDRMLVPVFFFGLGTLIRPEFVVRWEFAIALGAGVVLFQLRRWYFKRRFAALFGGDASSHGIAAPMLTIAAVAVELMASAGVSSNLIAWTLAASLTLTLCAAFNRRAKDRRLVDYELPMAAPEAIAALEAPQKE